MSSRRAPATLADALDEWLQIRAAGRGLSPVHWVVGGRAARDALFLGLPGLVCERVVFVGDHPPVVHLAQADGEPQPLFGVSLEVGGRAAAK